MQKKYRTSLWSLDIACWFYGECRNPSGGSARETKEETQATPKIIAPYTAFSLTHISQVHFFYLAQLGDEKFGPTAESSEVKLFTQEEIPWDEIAFPTVTKTLKYYFDDMDSGNFPFREEALKLW